MEKLSLPLYEPGEVEIDGKVYKLRPMNRQQFRRLCEIDKKADAAEAAGDIYAPVEAAYELAQLYIDAPPEVIDELPLEQIKEISAFVNSLVRSTKKKTPGGEAAPDPAAAAKTPPDAGPAAVAVPGEDLEKNALKPGDGTAA